MVPRGIVFARLSWRASYNESTRSPPLAWRVRDENGASVVEIAPDEGFEAPASIVGTYSIDVIEYNLFILSSTFALAARRRAVSATRDRIGEYGRVRHPTVDIRRSKASSIPSPSTRIMHPISLSPRLLLSPPKDGPSVRRTTESVSTVEFGTRRSILGVRILHRYHPHRRG